MIVDVDGKSDFQAYSCDGLRKRRGGNLESGVASDEEGTRGGRESSKLAGLTLIALTCFDWVYRFGGLRLQKRVCSPSISYFVHVPPASVSVSDARVDQSGS